MLDNISFLIFKDLIKSDDNFRALIIKEVAKDAAILAKGVEDIGGGSILMANYEKVCRYDPDAIRKSITKYLKGLKNGAQATSIIKEVRRRCNIDMSRTTIYWYLNNTEDVERRGAGNNSIYFYKKQERHYEK